MSNNQKQHTSFSKPPVMSAEAEKLLTEYRAITSETSQKQQVYKRAKLRNNIILGSIVVACVAVNIALVVVPPIGIAGAVLIGASAALGGFSTLGNYFNKKTVSKKENEFQDSLNRQEVIEAALKEQGFTIDKQKDSTIISNEKFGFKETIEVNQSNKITKTNRFFEVVTPILSSLNNTIRNNVDISKAKTGVKIGAQAAQALNNELKNKLEAKSAQAPSNNTNTKDKIEESQKPSNSPTEPKKISIVSALKAKFEKKANNEEETQNTWAKTTSKRSSIKVEREAPQNWQDKSKTNNSPEQNSYSKGK